MEVVIEIVSSLLGVIVNALGLILILIIQGLIFVASIQEFTNYQPIVAGWRMVRDLSNMFFVVILIIIAFGTILHVESYNFKKWLPKLVLFAVLINFSKTICGLMIDVSQVVMLTFVNAFKDVGGANLTEMLGITSILKLKGEGVEDLFVVIGAYVLGMIYLLIACVVVATIAAMLAMRLVMLWVYIVLSPLAYLLAAFPGGSKYSSQWWSKFTELLISGPVLAFFLWFGFFVLGSGNNTPFESSSANSKAAADIQSGTNNDKPVVATAGSTPSALIKFMVGIGMLLAGMKISSEAGGALGSIAGKGMAKINAGKTKALGVAKGVVSQKAKQVGRTGLGLASYGAKRIGEAGDIKTLTAIGKTGLAWRRDTINTDNKEKVDKRQKFLKKIGMRENSLGALNDLQQTSGGKMLSTAIHSGGAGAYIGTAVAGPIGAAIGSVLGGIVGVGGAVGAGRLAGNFKNRAAGRGIEADAIEKQIIDYNDQEKIEKFETENINKLKDEFSKFPDSTDDEKKENEKNKNTSKIETKAAEDARQRLESLNDPKVASIYGTPEELQKQRTNLEMEEQQHLNKAAVANEKVAKFKDKDESRNSLNESIKKSENKVLDAQAEMKRLETENGSKDQLNQEAAKLRNGQKWFNRGATAASNVEKFTSETTQRAAAEGCRKMNQAKNNVKNIATSDGVTAIKDLSPYTFYGDGEELAKKLVDGSEQSNNAIANLEKFVTDLNGVGGAKEVALVQGMAKLIAASGDAGASSFGKLKAEINSFLTRNPLTMNDHASVDSYSKIINPYNMQARSGELADKNNINNQAVENSKRQGKFHINTFAKNDNGQGGSKREDKNVIGVDFNKMKERNIDLDTSNIGVNVSGDLRTVCQALIEEIKAEKNDLAKMKSDGVIGVQEYDSRQGDLSQAEKRLANPENIKDLNFVNTAHPNYSRQEAVATVYHEQIHGAGVKNEEVTESISKSLMANNLYGNNKETGGRHAVELGKLAQEKLDLGMSEKEVIGIIDQEIALRVNSEGRSPAARIISKEKGIKEPISSILLGDDKKSLANSSESKFPNFDTNNLEEAIKGLPTEIANSFKKFIPSNSKIGVNNMELTNRLLGVMNKSINRIGKKKDPKKQTEGKNNLVAKAMEEDSSQTADSKEESSSL